MFGKEDGSRQMHFDRSWHRLFALAGLDYGRDKGLVWHSLRHEFISRVAETTEDVNPAREMARHADIRTTQRYNPIRARSRKRRTQPRRDLPSCRDLSYSEALPVDTSPMEASQNQASTPRMATGRSAAPRSFVLRQRV